MDAYFVQQPSYGPAPMYMPRGMCSIPLEFENLIQNTKEKLKIYGGWIGTKLLDDGSVAPEQGWAICHEDIQEPSIDEKLKQTIENFRRTNILSTR
mmetsp:Transcript_24053/g.21068  ORF Transcript_24053/g.21068 Transcript_24053/m.21068 type:complete len:96 (-) Transcript_24053:151-438(-)